MINYTLKLVEQPNELKLKKINKPINILKNIKYNIFSCNFSCDYYNNKLCITNYHMFSENISNKLEELCCEKNLLTELPDLHKSLKYLECSANYLIELTELPESLLELLCDNNNLTKLPKLLQSLTMLLCYNNKLTELPELPQSLEYFHCYNNPIQYITKHNYEIMKKIYLNHSSYIQIYNTPFFDNSGLSEKEFFSEL